MTGVWPRRLWAVCRPETNVDGKDWKDGHYLMRTRNTGATVACHRCLCWDCCGRGEVMIPSSAADGRPAVPALYLVVWNCFLACAGVWPSGEC